MPLVAKKIRTATTIHRELGPSSVSSILKSSRIHGASRFLGVKKPYRKVTIEDVKYVLSNHYQDTIYDPYGPEGDHVSQRTFRTIGINRTSQTAILQLRPNKPQETTGIQWISYGSMPYNTAVPFFTQVDTTPDYFANTTAKVTTDSFYWANRIIAGLADPHYAHHVW